MWNSLLEEDLAARESRKAQSCRRGIAAGPLEADREPALNPRLVFCFFPADM